MEPKQRRKMTELCLIVLGAMLVTAFLSITLNIPFYAIGIIVSILLVIMITGIWRWKQGDNQISDVVDINPLADEILVLTDDFPSLKLNKKLWKCVGSVYGESIVATHMVNDFWSSTKVLIGGEPKGYQKIMNLARRASINRMKLDAWEKKAGLITGHRLVSPQITSMSAEIISYGTAWKRIRRRKCFVQGVMER